MTISIPQLALVVLVGVSGSGKSTFARKHFRSTEVLSSDHCRGLVADDESAQAATTDAFDVLHYIAGKRLKNGLLTVVDATNLRPEDRRKYIELAREHHCLPVAIVLDVPEQTCRDRNAARPDRDFGFHVLHVQRAALRRHLKGLRREGFRHVTVMRSVEEIEAAVLERAPLWNDKRDVTGPFDIIGDVHGCFDELVALLERLGYQIHRTHGNAQGDWSVTPPQQDAVHARTAVFLGDLVDRGPNSPAVLRLVMRMVAEGKAYCVPGNHDIKLLRKLCGQKVQVRHGLAETLAQLEGESETFLADVREFLDGLVSHYVFDDGRLVVAHAGLKESMQGRGSGKVREFCLYGETTGETDEFGLPVRYEWAASYRGRAIVVYGHTPTPAAAWLNDTICIDTGCVFGGKLTALRYPERELVDVPARCVHASPIRPFENDSMSSSLTMQQRLDDMLDLSDVSGKRIIDTRLQPRITIREEHAAAAIEALSRFAADPRWIIYVPPTMSPCEASGRPGYLEHPAEAFDYYRQRGVAEIVCEEKHMGSRAVVIICRGRDTAERAFGVADGQAGIVYTRTGRRFFNDDAMEQELLERMRGAMDRARLWDHLDTDWICLDCELMPWSVKAQQIILEQYAAVGCAGRRAMAAAERALADAADRLGGDELSDLRTKYSARHEALVRYSEAYRAYCWPCDSIDDLRIAPFHVLATAGNTHVSSDHVWHMETLARLAADDELIIATPFRVASLLDDASCERAMEWWTDLTSQGGEGVVVKPRDFVAWGRRGVLQPAVKCRGTEYLRIIYGPEYLSPDNLDRLRQRGLNRKRSLALREFALGIESLERFARREPLRRVHECVFGVLALESEPVDPRL